MNFSVILKNGRNSYFKKLIFKRKECSNQNIWTASRFLNIEAKNNVISSSEPFFNESSNRKNDKKATIFASSILAISGFIGLFIRLVFSFLSI